MDKKDIMYIAGGLCIILIIALVIKPVMTGQPINTGIPVATTPPPTIVPIAANANVITPVITPITPITTAPTPTPIPTWDASVIQMKIVDPSNYGVSFNQSLPEGTQISSTEYRNTSMTTIAMFVEKNSSTTQTIYIPFPYWQLVYTIDPVPELQISKGPVVTLKGEGISYSGVSSGDNSYSGATPKFTIQVMDGNDPNRIVRTITPPGGIDLDLWLGNKKTVTNPQELKSGNQKATVSSDTVYVDPRPWTEKFYEGQRGYYFIINAHAINSYLIEICVPTKYVKREITTSLVRQNSTVLATFTGGLDAVDLLNISWSANGVIKSPSQGGLNPTTALPIGNSYSFPAPANATVIGVGKFNDGYQHVLFNGII